MVLTSTWDHLGMPLSDSEHPFISGWIHTAEVAYTLPCTSSRFISNFLNAILFLFWSIELIFNTGPQRPSDAIFMSLVTSVNLVLPWKSYCDSLPYQLFSTTFFLTHFLSCFVWACSCQLSWCSKKHKGLTLCTTTTEQIAANSWKLSNSLLNEKGVKMEVKKVIKIFRIE